MKVLEFKSAKEDYYIQQLNTQTTWIVVFVSTLFLAFSLVEYSLFLMKVEETKNAYDEYENVTNDKIHNLEANYKKLELENAVC